ncbi:MAG TPA: hypothetical protein VF219_18720, partial [Vicinamibacterales bacterium]
MTGTVKPEPVHASSSSTPANQQQGAEGPDGAGSTGPTSTVETSSRNASKRQDDLAVTDTRRQWVFDKGAFLSVSGRNWNELNMSGSVAFRFVEEQRNSEAIIL